MKLILSRKGFDTANGGCPSPIFPDGTMFSLPIPEDRGSVTYGNCAASVERLSETKIGEVVADLTRGCIGADHHAHMSPDLEPPNGWPRLFDQVKAAKSHLKKQGVMKDDIFLFFGLFQRVEKDGGGTWQPICKPRHVLWGWLQVEAIRNCGEGDEKLRCSCGNSNTRYVAREKLDIGDGIEAPGAGVFRFDKRLLLTDPNGAGVTHWRLPKIFHPHRPKTPLTYHGKRKWTIKGDYTYVQRNGPGQEFVLDLDRDKYDGVKDWALGLIREFGTK